MSYKTVETWVEVEVDLSEWKDDELISEMKDRGFSVIKGSEAGFNREDWRFLLDLLDKQPETWYTRRVRDKLLEASLG